MYEPKEPPKEVPKSAYGTSSARYGEVSPTGQVLKTPEQISQQYFVKPASRGGGASTRLPPAEPQKPAYVPKPQAAPPPTPPKKEEKPYAPRKDYGYSAIPERLESVYAPPEPSRAVYEVRQPPKKMYGTTSEKYGQVSPTGEVEKYPALFWYEPEPMLKQFDYQGFVAGREMQAQQIAGMVKAGSAKLSVENIGAIKDILGPVEFEAFRAEQEGTTQTPIQAQLKAEFKRGELGELKSSVQSFESRQALKTAGIFVGTGIITAGIAPVAGAILPGKAATILQTGYALSVGLRLEETAKNLPPGIGQVLVPRFEESEFKFNPEALTYRTGFLAAELGGITAGASFLQTPAGAKYSEWAAGKTIQAKAFISRQFADSQQAWLWDKISMSKPVQEYRLRSYMKKGPKISEGQFAQEEQFKFRLNVQGQEVEVAVVDKYRVDTSLKRPGQRSLLTGKRVENIPKVEPAGMRNIDMASTGAKLADFGERTVYAYPGRQPVWETSLGRPISQPAMKESLTLQPYTKNILSGQYFEGLRAQLQDAKFTPAFTTAKQIPLTKYAAFEQWRTPIGFKIGSSEFSKPFAWMGAKPTPSAPGGTPRLKTVVIGETLGGGIKPAPASITPSYDVKLYDGYVAQDYPYSGKYGAPIAQQIPSIFDTVKSGSLDFSAALKGVHENGWNVDFDFGKSKFRNMGAGKVSLISQGRVQTTGIKSSTVLDQALKTEQASKQAQITAQEGEQASRMDLIPRGATRVRHEQATVPVQEQRKAQIIGTALAQDLGSQSLQVTGQKLKFQPPPGRVGYKPEPIITETPPYSALLWKRGKTGASLRISGKGRFKTRPMIPKADIFSLTEQDIKLGLGSPAHHPPNIPSVRKLFKKKYNLLSMRFPTAEELKLKKVRRRK